MKELARHIMVDFLPMKDFAENPLILTEGRGIYVTDVDGRRFIDGLSGTFCVNLGHGNRRLAEAASRQIERLALAAPTLGTSDRALELVKLLLDITPPQYTTVKLLSGGSEVTEAAIKMARQYWKQVGRGTKYKVLSHYRGYHGGTGHALAAGGWPSWRVPYEPLAGGFIHLHTPDPYRPPFPGGAGDARCDLRAAPGGGHRAGGARDHRGPHHRADHDVGRRGRAARASTSRACASCATATTSC